MDMEQFYTRSNANKGVEVPLVGPNGEKTEHWIRIRGTDSDAMRKATAKAKRQMVAIAALETPEEREAALDELELDIKVAMVISWSFKDEDGKPIPCEEKRVRKFLREAPQIADELDKASARRTLFFKNESTSSSDSSKAK